MEPIAVEPVEEPIEEPIVELVAMVRLVLAAVEFVEYLAHL